ncbi:MAG: hypothetical protein U9P38_07465 [Campylobacterota bacterium]|nr:hypothetical protein [Campylobacterota bacterium]
MWKLFLIIGIVFSSGCSYFTFNAKVCEGIASDPHATIPEECIKYIEEDVQKAFDNTKNRENESTNLIEFNEK